MHIRPNQLDPNIQLDALHSAQKAAAARTRKKLSESASEILAEADAAYVVEVEAEQHSHEQRARNTQLETGRAKKANAPDPGNSDNHAVSDWA